ncbi:MAG: hypothetical protein ABJK37_05570 [Paraglaciecola sp.]|uniref:hypothetical protein n=1 Tax=Paraglaciecola sp. TaxID=1920173 RepID=UPI003298036B
MIEHIRKISNPLTIIAIFAGLAEISGTVVLPLLEPESQRIYIWFLMLFPCLLILLFFLTLNFNYKVLYAPSDFKDEDNFLELFGKATPEDRIEKLKDEINDDYTPSRENENPLEETNSTNGVKYKELFRRNTAATYYLAEGLVLNKLSPEFTDFRSELVLNSKKHNFMFDAVGEKNGEIYAIEVKYFKSELNRSSISHSLKRIARVFKELPTDLTKNLKVILAVATESEDFANWRDTIIELADKHEFHIDIRMFSLPELEKELDTDAT